MKAGWKKEEETKEKARIGDKCKIKKIWNYKGGKGVVKRLTKYNGRIGFLIKLYKHKDSGEDWGVVEFKDDEGAEKDSFPRAAILKFKMTRAVTRWGKIVVEVPKKVSRKVSKIIGKLLKNEEVTELEPEVFAALEGADLKEKLENIAGKLEAVKAEREKEKQEERYFRENKKVEVEKNIEDYKTLEKFLTDFDVNPVAKEELLFELDQVEETTRLTEIIQPLLIACEVPGDEKMKVDIDNLLTLIRDLQEEAKGATAAMQIDLSCDITADGKEAPDAPLILPSRTISRNNVWERDMNDSIALGRARKNRSSMAKRIKVYDAGSTEVNGLYIYDGIYNSKPQFKGQHGFNIYWDNIFEAWVLCKNMVHEYYTCKGAEAKAAKMPPLQGWEKERGLDPLPKFEPLYKKKDRRRIEQEKKKKKRRGGGLELDGNNPNLVGTDAGESALTFSSMMEGPSTAPPSLETATGQVVTPAAASMKPEGNDAATAIALDDDEPEPAPAPSAPSAPVPSTKTTDVELSEVAAPSQSLNIAMPPLDPTPNTQSTANENAPPNVIAPVPTPTTIQPEVTNASGDSTMEEPPPTSTGRKNILDMAVSEDGVMDLTGEDDTIFVAESSF